MRESKNNFETIYHGEDYQTLTKKLGELTIDASYYDHLPYVCGMPSRFEKKFNLRLDQLDGVKLKNPIQNGVNAFANLYQNEFITDNEVKKDFQNSLREVVHPIDMLNKQLSLKPVNSLSRHQNELLEAAKIAGIIKDIFSTSMFEGQHSQFKRMNAHIIATTLDQVFPGLPEENLFSACLAAGVYEGNPYSDLLVYVHRTTLLARAALANDIKRAGSDPFAKNATKEHLSQFAKLYYDQYARPRIEDDVEGRLFLNDYYLLEKQ
jgi:hypothetical protein